MNKKISTIICLTGTINLVNAMKFPIPFHTDSQKSSVFSIGAFDCDSDSSSSSSSVQSDDEESKSDSENPMCLYKSTAFPIQSLKRGFSTVCDSISDGEQTNNTGSEEEAEEKTSGAVLDFEIFPQSRQLTRNLKKRARQLQQLTRNLKKRARRHFYKNRKYNREKSEEYKRIAALEQQVERQPFGFQKFGRQLENHRQKVRELEAQAAIQLATAQKLMTQIRMQESDNSDDSSDSSEPDIIQVPSVFDNLYSTESIESLRTQARKFSKISALATRKSKRYAQKAKDLQRCPVTIATQKRRKGLPILHSVTQAQEQSEYQRKRAFNLKKQAEECRLRASFLEQKDDEISLMREKTLEVLQKAISDAKKEQDLSKLIAARHELRVLGKKIKELERNAYIEYIRQHANKNFVKQILSELSDSVLTPDEQIIYDFERYNERRLAEYELKHTIGAYDAFYQQELKTYKSEVEDRPYEVESSEEEEEGEEEEEEEDDDDETLDFSSDFSKRMNPYEKRKDELIQRFELENVVELAAYQINHTVEEYDDFYKQQFEAYVREIDPDYADEYFE